MFSSLGDLMGASMIATDGGIGRICNFLFDDELWKIRYCVVDVGHWLARTREVLISMSAIDQPDWKTKTLRARLTKEQLRNGPDIRFEEAGVPAAGNRDAGVLRMACLLGHGCR